jgi:gluconolactonase
MKDKDASDSVAANKNKPGDTPPAELTVGTPVLVKSGYSFTEGPAVDKMGNVFFTDQPNDKIYRWDAASGEITYIFNGHRSC